MTSSEAYLTLLTIGTIMLENDNNSIDPNAGIGDFSPRPLSEFLLGPENPDEDDHQSKLDNLGAPDFEGQSDLHIIHTDLPRVPNAATEEPNDDAWVDKHNKRQAQRAKLETLGQRALDAVYAEEQFFSDPRFKELDEIARGKGEPTDEEMMRVGSALKDVGTSAMIEFITGALKYPAERKQAVSEYATYRSMLEDFS